MFATLVLVLTLAQPAAAPTPAPAPTPAATADPAVSVSAKDKATARTLLREGTRLYTKGKHEAALDKFNRAYALYPSPKLLYNIAQANRELGRKVEALTAFEGFLAQVDKPAPRLAAEIRRSVAELQAQLAELQIQVDQAGAELTLDGQPLGRAPLADSIWVTPGPHEIAARKDGFLPATSKVEAAPGSAQQVAMALPPLARVAAVASDQPIPTKPVPPIYKRTWFWVAVGGAVVAGTVAAVAWTAGGGKPANSMR